MPVREIQNQDNAYFFLFSRYFQPLCTKAITYRKKKSLCTGLTLRSFCNPNVPDLWMCIKNTARLFLLQELMEILMEIKIGQIHRKEGIRPRFQAAKIDLLSSWITSLPSYSSIVLEGGHLGQPQAAVSISWSRSLRSQTLISLQKLTQPSPCKHCSMLTPSHLPMVLSQPFLTIWMKNIFLERGTAMYDITKSKREINC